MTEQMQVGVSVIIMQYAGFIGRKVVFDLLWFYCGFYVVLIFRKARVIKLFGIFLTKLLKIRFLSFLITLFITIKLILKQAYNVGAGKTYFSNFD